MQQDCFLSLAPLFCGIVIAVAVVIWILCVSIARDGQNIICIVELVKEILHNDWSKAVHLQPITTRLYMIIQRFVQLL